MACYIVSESHLPRKTSKHYNFCTEEEIKAEEEYIAKLHIVDQVFSNSLIQYAKFMGGKISGVSHMNQFKEVLKQGHTVTAYKHFTTGVSEDLFTFFFVMSLDAALNKQYDHSLEHRLAFGIVAGTSTFLIKQHYYVKQFHPEIQNIVEARSLSRKITVGHLGGFALGFITQGILKQQFPVPKVKNVTTGYHYLDTAYIGYKIYAVDSAVTGISDVVKLFIPKQYQAVIALVERVIDPLGFNLLWDYAVMPDYISAETINIVGGTLQISASAVTAYMAGQAIIPAIATTITMNAIGAVAFPIMMLVTEYAIVHAIDFVLSPIAYANSAYSKTLSADIHEAMLVSLMNITPISQTTIDADAPIEAQDTTVSGDIDQPLSDL